MRKGQWKDFEPLANFRIFSDFILNLESQGYFLILWYVSLQAVRNEYLIASIGVCMISSIDYVHAIRSLELQGK